MEQLIFKWNFFLIFKDPVTLDKVGIIHQIKLFLLGLFYILKVVTLKKHYGILGF